LCVLIAYFLNDFFLGNVFLIYDNDFTREM